MKLLRSMAIALCLAGCAHGTGPSPAVPDPLWPPPSSSSSPPAGAAPVSQPPLPPDPIPAIRAGVEALLRAQAEALWKVLTQGGSLDVAGTYQGHERLLAPAAVDQVRRARQRATGDERRALGYLHTFLVGELLSGRLAVTARSAARARAAATFEWRGRPVPARQLRHLLAAEPNAEQRAGLERAYATASSRWLPLLAEEDQALRDAIRKLGYPDTLALAEEARGQPVRELEALADGLLSQTENVYRALMDGLSRSELHVPLDGSRLHDLPRLFHASHEPHAFPAASQVPAALAAFDSLGLKPKKIPGLVLDLEARAAKSSRPIALPVEVPGSVRLSALPQGGATEARALLHELGAAIFYAEVTRPALEFRRLGPTAIPETWALLFEGLAGDPAWLAERTGLSGDALTREVRVSAAEELHQARLEAARVLYEIQRARNPAQAAGLQQQLLTRALARPIDAQEAARWALEPDPLLHTAEELRARLLSAQVAAFLVKRAGVATWWRSADNGQWLSSAWSEGTRRSPAELSASLGQPQLDAAAFTGQLQARARAAGVAF